MSYNFLPVQRDQIFLMPPSLTDWLPEDHLAWFVVDAVDQMDLRPLYERYREDGWGAAAFDPRMMVALLLYAYCMGERSSRRIERRCREDVAFRVICANHVPDHTTIARFRQNHEASLAACFTEVLRLCGAAGLLRVGVVALDGTKMEADASLHANRSLPQIEQEVTTMLAEAARADAEDDARFGSARGDELPSALRDRRSRIARLAQCRARLEREHADRETIYQQKLARRVVMEAERGKPLKGRKPKIERPRSPSSAKANVTDPDSRVMRGSRGLIQGYNAQAVVTSDHIVVASAVTFQANDRRLLRPMVERAQTNLHDAGGGRMGMLLADAGYWNEQELALLGPGAPYLLVAPLGGPPKAPSIAKQRMHRRLATHQGRYWFSRRAQIVEPVFGAIKGPRAARRFMCRGLSACEAEWNLLCTTNNLLKLWRFRVRGMQR